jgi:hypothetical protein
MRAKQIAKEECRLLGCYAMWFCKNHRLEESIPSIISVTRIGDLGTTLAAKTLQNSD